MQCPVCFQQMRKFVRCERCRRKLCVKCAMKCNGASYCSECYTDIFSKELVVELAQAFGIKEYIDETEERQFIKSPLRKEIL